MITGEGVARGPLPPARAAPSTPHLHRLPGRASGCARTRPGRTRREQTNPAGRGGREHPRAGPEMPSPTCHFARSCCRGCGHGRRLETQCVRACARARVCVCMCVCGVCVRSCLRCGSLTAPRATSPLPPTPESRPLSPLPARPVPPSRRPPPAPRLPASPRAILTSAEGGGSPRALLAEAAEQRRPAPPARPPARPRGSACPRPRVPLPLRGRSLPLPQPRVSLPVRLPAPEPELSPRSPNLPRLRSMPSAARPGWAGGGQGQGRPPGCREPAGGEGAPGGPGAQPRGRGRAALEGRAPHREAVGGASVEAALLRAPRGSPRPPTAALAPQHVSRVWGPGSWCVQGGAGRKSLGVGGSGNLLCWETSSQPRALGQGAAEGSRTGENWHPKATGEGGGGVYLITVCFINT